MVAAFLAAAAGFIRLPHVIYRAEEMGGAALRYAALADGEVIEFAL